jgi:hypothetical protein
MNEERLANLRISLYLKQYPSSNRNEVPSLVKISNKKKINNLLKYLKESEMISEKELERLENNLK